MSEHDLEHVPSDISEELNLSVFITNYNHGRFLAEALQSLEDQSYQPREIVVVDDASTDNSVEVIERFAERNERIRLFRNNENRGFLYNERRGMQELTAGTHYFGMSADDRIKPGLFEKLMSLLAEHPQAAFCSALSYQIDEQGKSLGLFPTPLASRKPRYIQQDEARELLHSIGPWFMGNTTIWRRELILECCEWMDELRWFYDGFLSQVLILRHGACFVPEPLGEFRKVENQLSQGGQDVQAALSIYGLAVDLMRTRYAELFSEDYIEHFKRRAIANSIEASIDRSGREHLAYLRSTLSRSRLVDKVMLAGVWLATRAQFCVAKLYLATVRHGFWGAVGRLLKLTILRPFARSPSKKGE